MKTSLLNLLQSVDTPTVCNAIEVAQGKRGFSNFTRDTMIPSDPKNEAIIGFARTASIKALEPSEELADILKARRMAYYKYMSDFNKHSIDVVDDLDFLKQGDLEIISRETDFLGVNYYSRGVVRDEEVSEEKQT